MKGTRYEKQIDLELYRQMVDLIYRLSAKDHKETIKWGITGISLIWEEPDRPMEEAYGLHYPGEVLERLKEKTELTLPKVRALSLALGQTKDLQEDGMFVGTQFPGFCQKAFRSEGQADCYLLAAKYLLEEKDKKHAYEEFLKYPWEKIEEMLFALSVLPEDDVLWEQIKARLNNCLGAQRQLNVYEDGELYLWISLHCAGRFQGYRKKDLDTLKYLVRLSGEVARSGSTLQKKILGAGYTLAETMFLNGFLVRESGRIAYDSITAERLAVDICKFFFSAEEVYPECAYELCGRFIRRHDRFAIKLEGTEGILKYLKNIIQIKNSRSYQCLYAYREKIYSDYAEETMFYIDLTDPRWDSLYAWMEKDEFDRHVTQTIYGKPYTDTELGVYLQRYEALTGNGYESSFWRRRKDAARERAFSRLTDAGYVDPVHLTKSYVQELTERKEGTEEKWKYMFSYLREYMTGINSLEAFQMMSLIMEAMGSLDPGTLPMAEILLNSFTIKNWGGSGRNFEDMSFLRPFLTAEEHDAMFSWLEQSVFQSIPEEYVYFLVNILEDPVTLLWMKEEEAKEICFRILPLVRDDIQNRLQKRFMTAEDYERMEQAKQERRRRADIMEKEKKVQRLKRAFTRQIAENTSKCQFQPVFDFLEKSRYPMRETAKTIVAGFLSDFWRKGRPVTASRREAADLLVLEAEYLGEGLLHIDTIRETALGLKEETDA